MTTPFLLYLGQLRLGMNVIIQQVKRPQMVLSLRDDCIRSICNGADAV